VTFPAGETKCGSQDLLNGDKRDTVSNKEQKARLCLFPLVGRRTVREGTGEGRDSQNFLGRVVIVVIGPRRAYRLVFGS
jgi:hypothetical protein